MRKEGKEMIRSISKYIKDKDIECSKCGEKLEIIYTPKIYEYNVSNENRALTVLNAPMYKCRKCGKESESLFLYAEIEKMIEHEIFFRLNNKQEIPNEVEFSEFTHI